MPPKFYKKNRARWNFKNINIWHCNIRFEFQLVNRRMKVLSLCGGYVGLYSCDDEMFVVLFHLLFKLARYPSRGNHQCVQFL